MTAEMVHSNKETGCRRNDQACGVMPVNSAPRQCSGNKILFVKKFLVGRQVTVLENAPYSPDLAPCDFFLFPKIKSALKGTHSGSMDEVKVKTAELLYSLTPNDLQHCFEQWKIRMQRCVDREGMYVEGDN